MAKLTMYVFGTAIFLAALSGGGYLSSLGVDEFSRATDILTQEIDVGQQQAIASSHHLTGTIAMVGAVGSWLFGLTAALAFVVLGRTREKPTTTST